jgi:hypothetical protein
VKGRGVPLGYVEGLNDARTKLAGFFSTPLDRFLDLATTQAASADPDALCLTVDQRPDRLEVGFEDPFGLVVGVTDVMAGLTTLAAEIACECHGDTPSCSRMLKKSSS